MYLSQCLCCIYSHAMIMRHGHDLWYDDKQIMCYLGKRCFIKAYCHEAQNMMQNLSMIMGLVTLDATCTVYRGNSRNFSIPPR